MSANGRALWALAEAMSGRPGWRLEGATITGEWTSGGWRVSAMVSVFFGDDQPRGPATVFSIDLTSVVPDPRWRTKLMRSAWHRALLAELGSGYRSTAYKHARRRSAGCMTVLRTADLREVTTELDRVASVLGGAATRTTVRGGRPTLYSLCASIATSDGPWRVEGLSYRRRARTRRSGVSWLVWKSLNASTSYEWPGKSRGPGVLSMLGVSPSDWSPETRKGLGPLIPKTEQQLLRAGYKPMHEADDRAATFIHLHAGLRRRPAFRELDRLEHLGLS